MQARELPGADRLPERGIMSKTKRRLQAQRRAREREWSIFLRTGRLFHSRGKLSPGMKKNFIKFLTAPSVLVEDEDQVRIIPMESP